MGYFYQWRYKFCFMSMVIYMSTLIWIACTLLWNIAITHSNQLQVNDNLDSQTNQQIPICATKQKFLNDSLHDCTNIGQFKLEKFIATGWTKVVHEARKTENGPPVAFKSVHSEGKDVTDCSKSETLLHCHNRAVDKLEQEVNLFKDLQHETFVKMENYCLKTKGDNCLKFAAVVVELGEPLTNLRLLQLTWKQRLQVIRDLSRLVHFAESSPLGTLGLADLRRPQFVLVDNRLKFGDLDDIIIGDPVCSADSHCSSLDVKIECISNVCRGFNAKLNIQKSFKEFGPYIFIADGVPEEARGRLEELRLMWKNNNATTSQLVSAAMSL